MRAPKAAEEATKASRDETQTRCAPKDSKSWKGAAKDQEEKAASDAAEDSDWELADEQSKKEASKNPAQQNKALHEAELTRLAAEKFVELIPQHLVLLVVVLEVGAVLRWVV